MTSNSDLKIQLNRVILPLQDEIELVEDVDYMLGLSVSVEEIRKKGDTVTAVLRYNGGEYSLFKVKYD